MNFTISKKKNINLGIQILRMILCFWVLCFHYLEKRTTFYPLFYIIKTKHYHVPCFSFISFYFSYSYLYKRNFLQFQQRIIRLLIPYIIWPLIIYVIHLFIPKRKISLHDLKLQILLGTQFMVPLWYLFGLLLLTILFFIISNLFKNQFLLCIQLLGIFSLILQYSNYHLFLNEYKNNVRYPLLYTLGIFPISIISLSFASSQILEFIKTNRKKNLFISYVFIYILFKYEIFVNLGGYNGIINIFVSLIIFVGFYLLPLENIHPFIERIIKQLTNYTNGIYCLQSEIIIFLTRKMKLIRDLKSMIIMYLLSYFISFIGTIIFGKNKLKYLFI